MMCGSKECCRKPLRPECDERGCTDSEIAECRKLDGDPPCVEKKAE